MKADITWIAHYDNGVEFKQESGNIYPDVDRSKLIAFDLWQQEKLLIRIDLRGDKLGKKHLIWRMRNQIRSDGHKERMHLVGWFRDIEGKTVVAMCYVFENGTVLLGSQWRKDDYMHPVILLDCEKNE